MRGWRRASRPLPTLPARGRVERGPEDDAIILFTSGTSATPKGVILNFREYLLNIDPLAAGFGITADDRLYDFRPFSWNSAQTLGALAVVNRGATLVLGGKILGEPVLPAPARSRRHDRHRQSDDDQYSAQQRADGAHRDTLPKLRFVTSSSAPLLLEEWKRFEQKFGIPVAQGCGASEVSWIAAIPGEGAASAGSAGRWPITISPLSMPRAGACRPGEIGYVELGGLGDHPYPLSRRRRRGESPQPRPFPHRRSRLSSTPKASLTLSGREKELIIRGGAKISPVEIDSFLMQHADVIEAATIGVPDAIYGEEVMSYVVARPGASIDAEAILQYCAGALPAFKAPKRIVLSPSLPKTDRGKLDRKALAERWKG